MTLEKSLTRIKEFLLDRYKDNLAGILLFGTANTGEFREGKSDLDTMIFVKEQKGLNIDDEIKFLIEALKSERFATQYFHTLEGIIQYITERSSFSTYITIVGEDSSRILYSTPVFEETRQRLRENPPSKEDFKKYVKKKDEFELDGYFNGIEGFKLTKALFTHIRRKLQIMNYFKTGKLIFDYNNCANNLNLSASEKEDIEFLYDSYSKRKPLTTEEIDKFHQLAKQFTERVIKLQ
ncbi:MAG: nucleotidyltransferase domain-containing protein [Nanoarchaeota archaeon]